MPKRKKPIPEKFNVKPGRNVPAAKWQQSLKGKPKKGK